MRSFNSTLALSLVVAPLFAAPHAHSQETRPSTELLGASEIHSQSADLSPMKLAQATGTTPNPSQSSDATVSVKALLDAKVLDASNREMGSIKTLLADPQTGKLVRADIALKGSGGIMSKSDQQVSLPWEQLTVKRQGGNFVLVLNQEAMQKIQTIEKQDDSNRQNQQQQQKK